MDPQPVVTLEGRVADVLFHNPSNLYTVFVLDDGKEETPVVCDYPALSVGETLKATGHYVQHPEYGQQLKASAIEQVRPVGAAAVLDYLSGGAIKGIGPATAKRLVDKFGDRVFDIIENSPDQLTTVRGISPGKASQIAESYALLSGVRSTIAFVAQFGLDASVGIACYKCWKRGAVDLLTRDPYQLCCDEIGIGFDVADGVAAKLGIGVDADCRVRGGVLYVLRHNLQNGHVCLPHDKLVPVVCQMLDTGRDQVEMAVDDLCDEGQLVSDKAADGKPFIYLQSQFVAESYIAGRLMLMLRSPAQDAAPIGDEAIEAVEAELGIHYSDKQREALRLASESPVFVLTGGPGTGKTTTLNGLLRLLEGRGYKPALAAPTGRAAKRMGEVTGREAKTIHRMLEVEFADGEPGIKFKRNAQNPLGCDVLVLDEMSMVDALLFEAVLRAMRLGGRLIMVGDPDQLPSVGAGNVLSDIIASGCVPTVHLDEVFRQAAQSRIVTTAHSVVRGETLDLANRPDADLFFMRRPGAVDAAEAVVSLCTQRLPDKYGFSPTDIQVITPTRQGGTGTTRLNSLLQEKLNPPAPLKDEIKFGSLVFRVGDKVMQVRNNYDVEWERPNGETGLGIFNGDIGVITMVDRPSRSLIIEFDDREVQYLFDNLNQLELAYAITVHKSQGNEFDAVVMPLVGSHRHLHYRNLFYTGITRAKKLLVLVGQASTVQSMAANMSRNKRYTYLAQRLREEAL